VFKRNVAWAFKLIVIATPIIMWCAPPTFLDGDAFPVCASRLLFDIECLGCGMTRAALHAHHGAFDTAIAFNGGIRFIYPILWMGWLFVVYKSWKGLKDQTN